MTPPAKGFNLYEFQQRLLPVLLGWGLGSMACGLIWHRSRKAAVRALGSQFMIWGLVDGLIAGFGLRAARRKGLAFARGRVDPASHAREVRFFERIVALNVGLDVGYVLAGWWLMRASRAGQPRRGMGLGILLQGSFLLLWDVFLLGRLWADRGHG